MTIEEWRPVEGWPYEVSNLGRVRRSLDAKRYPGRLVGRYVSPDGYPKVHFSNGNLRWQVETHVIVATAFHGKRPPWAHLVRHLDGDPSNNRADNLVWGTYSDNEADKKLHGTDQRGERNGASKLSADLVRKIKLDSRVQQQIANDLGISQATVSMVKSGRRWGHVQVEAAA